MKDIFWIHGLVIRNFLTSKSMSMAKSGAIKGSSFCNSFTSFTQEDKNIAMNAYVRSCFKSSRVFLEIKTEPLDQFLL